MKLEERLATSACIAIGTGLISYLLLHFVALPLCYPDRYEEIGYVAAFESSLTGAIISSVLSFFISFLVGSSKSEVAGTAKNSVHRFAKICTMISVAWIVMVVFYSLINGGDICSAWQFRSFLAYTFVVPSLLGVALLTKIWLKTDD